MSSLRMVAVGVVLSTLVGCGFGTQGVVAAEQLSRDFVEDPCGSRDVYHKKFWTITGTVLGVEGIGFPGDDTVLVGTDPYWLVALESGEDHMSDGRDCPGTFGDRPFFPEGPQTQLVVLRWEQDDGPFPDEGEAVELTCRIILDGWGMNQAPGITATDCYTDTSPGT